MLFERQLYIIQQNKTQNVRIYYMCILYMIYVQHIRIAYVYCKCTLLCYDKNTFSKYVI